MKHIFTFAFIILLTKLSVSQTIDANLIELNWYNNSNPQNFVAFQNGFFFTAKYNPFGKELCYSNGTPTGTYLVKDIVQGSGSSNPTSLTIVDNTLFFTARDNAHGTELWKSDGTESGTIMVKNIIPDNSPNTSPSNLIAYNGILFFTVDDGINGLELWKSDGTEAGTVMVKDINPNGNGEPMGLFVFNNNIYFLADDGVHGFEIWRSDGTQTGTYMVKDICQNYPSFSYYEHPFLTLNNYFYFIAYDNSHGSELWKSDGTEAGTTLVRDIKPGTGWSAYTLRGSALNDCIIFEANDGIHGTELWKSDGTATGTFMIKNINNSSSSSFQSFHSQYVSFNNSNEVYFIANDNVHGYEIWKTDGSSNGTVLLKDINPGTASIGCGKIYVDNINNKLLFFSYDTNSNNSTLWMSDGSTNGTIELSNIVTSSNSQISGNEFATISNHTYFTGRNSINGNELWVTDYTTGGTSLFLDLNYSSSSYPSKFTNVNGSLFFKASGSEYGTQLFKSDGTIVGTQLVKDIDPGNDCIDDLSEMKEINGILYFSGNDGVHGFELWRSDGTEVGTYLVKDINPGNQSSMRNSNDTQKFWVINNTLYFNADDGVHGFELWRSDGTATGTFMIKDINTTIYSDSNAKNFVMLNNKVYFSAMDNTNITGLWTTDGTQLGTTKIISLNQIESITLINNNTTTSSNAKMIIIADTNGSGNNGANDIWASDGTASGTTLVQSFPGEGTIKYKTILNGELYFATRNPASFRKAVYKTDGTASGTVLLFDGANHPTMPDLYIGLLKTCGNYVYFVVEDNNHFNKEIWRTNGTITEQVTSQNTQNPHIRNLTCYKNNLLYSSELFPINIWITNDNLNQSLQLDINVLNGPNFQNNYNHSIEGMGATDNHLYLRARNEISGSELYVTDFDASTLGINDYETNNNSNFEIVRLYPNPTENIITIESISNSNIEKFEIWDLSGKIIYKEYNINLATISYDTNKLSEGIYFVKVFLSNKEINTLKLIVKN